MTGLETLVAVRQPDTAPSHEILANELFFHRTHDMSFRNRALTEADLLFGLDGRATISQGTVWLDRGTFMVYRIPELVQAVVVEPPRPGKFEEWSSEGIYALKQPIPAQYQEQAQRWIDLVKRRREKDIHPEVRKAITLDDVRYLDPKYLVGAIYVKGTRSELVESYLTAFEFTPTPSCTLTADDVQMSTRIFVAQKAEEARKRFNLPPGATRLTPPYNS